MAIYSNLSVVLGVANSQSVVATLGNGSNSWAYQTVTLSHDYTRNPPKDFPRAAAEIFQGSAWTEFGVIPSGSVIKCFAAEAVALIAANAAS